MDFFDHSETNPDLPGETRRCTSSSVGTSITAIGGKTTLSFQVLAKLFWSGSSSLWGSNIRSRGRNQGERGEEETKLEHCILLNEPKTGFNLLRKRKSEHWKWKKKKTQKFLCGGWISRCQQRGMTPCVDQTPDFLLACVH
jgi:hypothetical protein